MKKKKERMPAYYPFWTIPQYHGNGVDSRGYYFIDDRGVISGPYTTFIDAECEAKQAKQEFPRS